MKAEIISCAALITFLILTLCLKAKGMSGSWLPPFPVPPKTTEKMLKSMASHCSVRTSVLKKTKDGTYLLIRRIKKLELEILLSMARVLLEKFLFFKLNYS